MAGSFVRSRDAIKIHELSPLMLCISLELELKERQKKERKFMCLVRQRRGRDLHNAVNKVNAELVLRISRPRPLMNGLGACTSAAK